MKYGEAKRLPFVALILLVLIFALATPIFFITPRSSASVLTRSSGGLAGFTGFSDTMRLGEIGRLQESNRVVMHVRAEGSVEAGREGLRWRGVALDEYTGHGWHRSTSTSRYVQSNNERNFFQVGPTDGSHQLTTQTYFVEPIDTPVLFAASRAIAVQGTLSFVRRDEEDSLVTRQHDGERITYKVLSDTTEPEPDVLRESILHNEVQVYEGNLSRYLQLPETLDRRVAGLARNIITSAGARNRYDAARAIEAHLQSEQNYRYTLDLKAGGADPLADFLFNVHAGHCEYFATAMAVMLRTQGIASRVVNGFRTGEYNEAADAYTVTEKEAHSWVEVYFPEAASWVTFDPTPVSGRPMSEHSGLSGSLGKYAEALQLLWFQYVVGYDKQGQRSLATSVRNHLFDYRQMLAGALDTLKEITSKIFKGVPGSASGETSSFARVWRAVFVVAAIFTLLALLWMARRIYSMGFWRGLFSWRSVMGERTVIEFYEQMINLLAARGLRRAANETPLEFASATAIAEVLKITRAYNRVRYGGEGLSPSETAEIDAWLTRMKE